MSQSLSYFAYGSNMNPLRMQARDVIFTRRSRAILRGYELRFNKRSQANPERGAANIVPVSDGLVEGILYELESVGIERLDAFEGYPLHYTRQTVCVELSPAKLAEAVAYIAHPSQVDDALRPEAEYLAHLLAADDVLSGDYLHILRQVQIADDSA